MSSGPLRRGLSYRSSVLNSVSANREATLRKLGILAIFDLRNAVEQAQYLAKAIGGIDIV